MELKLTESEVKLILEVLTKMESDMSHIWDTSTDEDEIANIGNDLIELRLLFNPLKDKATSEYGKGILNFSRESL